MNVTALFTATVKNTGSVDAGNFQVVVVYSLSGSNDQTAFANAQTVTGLAPGKSVALDFYGVVNQGGDYVFAATADSADEVTESNEGDNTRTLKISTADLPNLAFDSEGIILATCIGGPDWNVQFDFGVNNIGTAPVTQPFEVSIKWYLGGTSSGTLDPAKIDAPLAPGEGNLPEFCRMLPGPGKYQLDLSIDSGNVIDESDETDNDISVDWNIPCFSSCPSP